MYLRQGLGENVSKLFLYSDEINLDEPPICTFSDVVVSDFYVLTPVMQNWIFDQGDRSFVVHI